MTQQLWVVGEHYGGDAQWAMVGVYDSEERARAECLEHSYFYAPIDLNFTTPKGREDWPGVVYPVAEAK